MEIHSSILAWRIPRTEDSGGLQSIGWYRDKHDWVTNTHKIHQIHLKRIRSSELFCNLKLNSLKSPTENDRFYQWVLPESQGRIQSWLIHDFADWSEKTPKLCDSVRIALIAKPKMFNSINDILHRNIVHIN